MNLKAFKKVFDKSNLKNEKNVHRIAKSGQVETNDIDIVKCIKDQDKNNLVHEEKIKNR